jgi:hypothetical protein
LLEQEPHFLEMSELPQGNDPSIRNDPYFGKLFDATPIPDQVEGFECADRDQIAEVWPEGTEAAKEVSDTSVLLSMRPDTSSYCNGSCTQSRANHNYSWYPRSPTGPSTTTRTRACSSIKPAGISSMGITAPS